MTTYRTGGHWGRTIVRVGTQPPDIEHGISHRPDDELVGVMDDPALAERIAWLLTHTCPTCMGPSRETVAMVCQTCGTDYARLAGIRELRP